MKKIKPSPSQESAIHHSGENAALLCVAGSGKTTSMVLRVAKLLENGADPSRILLITFTKTAATEMKTRIADMVPGQVPEARTFHSFAYQVLKDWGIIEKHPRFLGKSTNWKKEVWIKAALKAYRINEEPLKALTTVERMQACGIHHCEPHLSPDFGFTAEDFKVYRDYGELKYEEKMNEFDDLLIELLSCLRQTSDLRKALGSRYDYVMVDEYQDTNPAQEYILEYLCQCPNPTERAPLGKAELMVIGDDDQCHIPGAHILTDNGFVEVQDLNPRIDSIQSGGLHMWADHNPDYAPFTLQEAAYDGTTVNISIPGLTTLVVTPNHRIPVSIEDAGGGAFLLRRYIGGREQWCYFRNSGRLGNSRQPFKPETVRRQQGATDLWWLPDTVMYIYEDHLYRECHRVPFRGHDEYSDEECQSYWSNVTSSGYPRTLMEHHEQIDPVYPMCTADDPNRYINPRWCLVPAGAILANVFGLWKVANDWGDSDYDLTWSNFTIANVGRGHWTGPVYSLDVPPHRVYCADGYAVHNSIFSFRGGSPKTLVHFQEKWGGRLIKMEENYRSCAHVLETANAVIANNTVRVEKKLKHTREDVLGDVTWVKTWDEAQTVSNLVRALVAGGEFTYKDIAILYRAHMCAGNIESRFTGDKVPYQTVSESGGFFGLTENKTLLSYIRAATDLTDVKALEHIWTRPNKFLRKVTLMTAIEELNPRARVDKVLKGIRDKADGIEDFALGDKMRTMLRTLSTVRKSTPKEALRFLLNELSYGKYLYDIELRTRRPSEDMMSAVSRTISVASEFKTNRTFLDHINKAIDNASNYDPEADKVSLMTVHASKGLEFPVVIIVGLSDEIFPHKRQWQSVQEERRLFYVAVTRAQNKCFLMEPMTCSTRSRFFEELSDCVAEPEEVEESGDRTNAGD